MGFARAWQRRVAAGSSAVAVRKAAGSSSPKSTDLTRDCAGRERLTHSKERRLRSKREFDAVYAHGRRFGNSFFGVTVHLNDKGWPRLGLAVAVKTAGNAVERNRIRRTIRESFRLHRHEIPALDLVVSARARARGTVAGELRAQLESLWLEVRTKCGSWHSS
jgi:ribonuclease P protein component